MTDLKYQAAEWLMNNANDFVDILYEKHVKTNPNSIPDFMYEVFEDHWNYLITTKLRLNVMETFHCTPSDLDEFFDKDFVVAVAGKEVYSLNRGK